MSEAFWAAGSILQLGDAATPEVFTAIAELVDVVPPVETRDSTQVTHHGSPNKRHEYIPGMADGGTVTFKVNWLPSNATHNKTTGLRKTFEEHVNRNWKLILPDSILTITFTGHITNWNPQTPLPSQGSLDVSIKITGMPGYSQ